MALSSTVEAAIKGSIANPEAAQMVIDAVKSSSENPLAGAEPSAAVAAISTVDASDPATTQAMANEVKVKVNAVIAALKAAGLMES